MTGGIRKDRIRMTVGEARALGEAAMVPAMTTHANCADAALCGYEYSGLPKLLNVVDHPAHRFERSALWRWS